MLITERSLVAWNNLDEDKKADGAFALIHEVWLETVDDGLLQASEEQISASRVRMGELKLRTGLKIDTLEQRVN